MNCETIHTEIGDRIGGGGHGDIYELGSRNVVKGIRERSNCDNADTEFEIQKLVYEDVACITSQDPVTKWEEIAKQYAVVPKPITFCNREQNIKNVLYECTVVMELIDGIKIDNILNINPEARDSLSEEYMSLNGDSRSLIHLALNLEGVERFYGAKEGVVSLANPSRGYVATLYPKESILLESLRAGVPGLPRLELNHSDITNTIGYLYANMFYHTHIIPLDVEFVLGVRDGNYIIGIIDFGLSIDMNNPETWKKKPEYKQLLSSRASKTEKVDNLRMMVMDDISLDLYCNLDPQYKDEPFSGFKGWDSVESEFKSIYVALKHI